MPELRHRPVATATGRFRTIFLMDTLRTENTLETVLQNYLGLFWALRDQEIKFIVLMTMEPELLNKSGSDFRNRLQTGLQVRHKLDFQIRSTVDICRLLKELLPSLSPEECKRLQYPSLFAQDPFVALQYAPGFLVMLSSIYSSIAFSYAFISDAIADGVGEEKRFVLPTYYTLTGGNILAQPDWAIIGRDTLDLNLNREFTPAVLEIPGNYDKQVAQITLELQALLGVSTIYWTGTDFSYPQNPFFQQGKYQPSFHIDFYLTPVGPSQNPETCVWEELIFVGELVTYNTSMEPEQLKVIEQIGKGLDEAAAYFSELESPAGLPFRVKRIPLLLVGVTDQREVVNKLLSWNQVLVQNTKTNAQVFMPDYVVSSDKTDGEVYAEYQQDAIEAYASEGFSVTMVQG
ncbi:MAG TPA: hypothetical protein ENJ82_13260, partial [Bacteroidetes bacterium]|nr:hypothetical protein [Bacteroidota bacterium]